MKNIVHLYVTDKCSTHCPFCLMASGPENNNFLDVSVLKKALGAVLDPNGENVVRLIGGEPSSIWNSWKYWKRLPKTSGYPALK